MSSISVSSLLLSSIRCVCLAAAAAATSRFEAQPWLLDISLVRLYVATTTQRYTPPMMNSSVIPPISNLALHWDSLFARRRRDCLLFTGADFGIVSCTTTHCFRVRRRLWFHFKYYSLMLVCCFHLVMCTMNPTSLMTNALPALEVRCGSLSQKETAFVTPHHSVERGIVCHVRHQASRR